MILLRGEIDTKTLKSIENDDDVWLQLAKSIDPFALVGFFAEPGGCNRHYSIGQYDFQEISCPKIDTSRSTCFSRGGFPWQAEIMRQNNFKFKIRYGAGRRIFPEYDIWYDLILVDSTKQKRLVKARNKRYPVELFIKPAARHFKYVDVEKKYDICFIAKDEQAKFKGVRWVYDTIPKSLNVLHLGSDGRYNPPSNVTCMRVNRIKMPNYINQCKIGIVPYWNEIDSCPRIIPEMIACGLPVICSDQVHYWREKYPCNHIDVTNFWGVVQNKTFDYSYSMVDDMTRHYKDNLSIEKATEHLLELVKKNSKK